MANAKSPAPDLPDPAPVLDGIEAFRRSKALFAAVALDVFDRLAQSPADPAKLAGQLGANRDAIERLLDACVGMGLLKKQRGMYSNQPVAATYLVRSSPHSLSGYILYSNNALYPMWGNLEDAVREGKSRWKQTFGLEGPIFDHFFKTDEARRDFLAGMQGFGLISSPRVVEAFDLGKFRHLVDLGGGTGHLAVAACERYPEMRAKVFDMAAVVEIGKQYVAHSPVADRVEFVAGDFFTDALPEGDLFTVGRVLHDWTDEKVGALLAKIYERLPSGGALLVAERLLNDDKSGPVPTLMQSLNMLVCTEGKERTLAEYAALLCDAGFEEVLGRKTGAPLDAVMAVKK
jgi:ubiquinone/menaquinone biosynthesis C-methylase UbiE